MIPVGSYFALSYWDLKAILGILHITPEHLPRILVTIIKHGQVVVTAQNMSFVWQFVVHNARMELEEGTTFQIHATDLEKVFKNQWFKSMKAKRFTRIVFDHSGVHVEMKESVLWPLYYSDYDHPELTKADSKLLEHNGNYGSCIYFVDDGLYKRFRRYINGQRPVERSPDRTTIDLKYVQPIMDAYNVSVIEYTRYENCVIGCFLHPDQPEENNSKARFMSLTNKFIWATWTDRGDGRFFADLLS